MSWFFSISFSIEKLINSAQRSGLDVVIIDADYQPVLFQVEKKMTKYDFWQSSCATLTHSIAGIDFYSHDYHISEELKSMFV